MIQTIEEEEESEAGQLQQSFKDVEDFFARKEAPKEEVKVEERVPLREIHKEEAKIEDEDLSENFWNELQSLVSDLSDACLAAALSPMSGLSNRKRKSYDGKLEVSSKKHLH